MIELVRNTKEKIKMKIDENYEIPVWTICGKEEGKTLIITAGVHGCEYVGIESIKKIYNMIDSKDIKGNIVILPLTNQEGFYSGSKQVNPIDNKNLNREFLSDTDTITDRIVRFIKQEIYTIADFILDLHGGDINESMTPLVFCPGQASEEVNRISEEAAMHLPVNYRIPTSSKNGLYSCATSNGIPGLLLEIGGNGRYSKPEVEMCIEGVFGVMSYLELIDKREVNQNQKRAKKAVYDGSISKGYWYPEVTTNQQIKEGDLVGTLKDIDDNIIAEYKAQFDATVMYYTTSLGVDKGDHLICYAQFN